MREAHRLIRTKPITDYCVNVPLAFVCSIAAAKDGITLETFTADVRGTLLRAPRGSDGFGYDPLFYFPEWNKSFAQLSRHEKLQVSHRGAAFRMFLNWMNETDD